MHYSSTPNLMSTKVIPRPDEQPCTQYSYCVENPLCCKVLLHIFLADKPSVRLRLRQCLFCKRIFFKDMKQNIANELLAHAVKWKLSWTAQILPSSRDIGFPSVSRSPRQAVEKRTTDPLLYSWSRLISGCVSLLISCTTTKKLPNLFFFPLLAPHLALLFAAASSWPGSPRERVRCWPAPAASPSRSEIRGKKWNSFWLQNEWICANFFSLSSLHGDQLIDMSPCVQSSSRQWPLFADCEGNSDFDLWLHLFELSLFISADRDRKLLSKGLSRLVLSRFHHSNYQELWIHYFQQFSGQRIDSR